ncbi:MAG: hypothetical protein ABJF10_11040 [Chthoniobacter sp.]|uniref:hypothetical protein n=1 Tax=Chthoniobacter sp. TaxID=2510640 RepID=UPI0032A4887A
MTGNEILRKARGLRRNITASGSPFRYLRKGLLNLTRPVDTLRRISHANAVARCLPPDLRSKLDALNASGYADALSEMNPALLAELDMFCQDKLVQNPDLQSRMTAYWANLNGPLDRTVDGILVRFALQEPVLKLAAAYFGQVPYLADVDISVSFSTGKPQWETSQLWHRDYADHKTIKLWVYLTDVISPEDGPLTYVEPGPSAKIRNTFFPGRVKDETIAECVAPGEVKQIFGKPSPECVRITNAFNPGIPTARWPHQLPKAGGPIKFELTFHESELTKPTAALIFGCCSIRSFDFSSPLFDATNMKYRRTLGQEKPSVYAGT